MLNEWNIDKLIPLLSACGATAMKYYENPPLEMKQDNTVVTAADKAIEQALSLEFDHPDQGVFIIGEETSAGHSRDYFSRALRETCWVVDPIDGTAPYSNRIPSAWGISVALMRNSIIEEGALYFPAIKELIITNKDEVLISTDFVPGQSKMPTLNKLEFGYRTLGTGGMVSISQMIAKHADMNFPDQVVALSGCIASISGLIQGRFPAYISTLKLWDIAASLAIISHGNYVSRLLNGAELSTKIDNTCFELDTASPNCWKMHGHAVIASSPETLKQLTDKIVFPGEK